jgi:hypothetical protein
MYEKRLRNKCPEWNQNLFYFLPFFISLAALWQGMEGGGEGEGERDRRRGREGEKRMNNKCLE